MAKAAKVVKDQNEATPTTFLLDLKHLVPSIEVGSVGPFPTHQPRIFESVQAIQELMTNPKAQMAIGNFGSTYKRTDMFKEHGWYQAPMVSGKGCEECQSMFNAFGPDKDGACSIPGLAHKPATLGEIYGVVSAWWSYGIDTCKFFANPGRNGLAQLKVQCAGTISQLVFCVHRL